MKRRKKKAKGRSIPVTDEMYQILERQRVRFREKFGREPGPTDPIFFDFHADEPRPMDMDHVETTLLRAMETAGINPRLIYAYRRTGRMVTRENWQHLTDEDRAEWQAALEEYDALHERRN